MWFSKQVEHRSLATKIMKQSYCLIGYVKDGEFVIWIKNNFGGERLETKALFENFEYFKKNFIDGINHYKIIQEKIKLKAIQEDFV